MARFTDGGYPSNSSPDDADVIMTVDVSDTTDHADGSSKTMTLSALRTYVGSGKTVLSSNTTYYVATTGDNGDTGGSGDPWLTIEYALAWISEHVHANGYTITVDVANGTYASVAIAVPTIEGVTSVNPVVVTGDTGTPSNVNLNGANSGNTLTVYKSSVPIKFEGFTFGGTTPSRIVGVFGGHLILDDVTFSAAQQYQMHVINGYLELLGVIESAGNAPYLLYIDGGYVIHNGTMTLTSTPTYSTDSPYVVTNGGYLRGPYSGETGTFGGSPDSAVSLNGVCINYSNLGGAFTASTGGQAVS